jgi:hypothetical protein
MKFPIYKVVVAAGSMIVYFKKRKLYVDDKFIKIRILPKKSVKIYRKDVLNIISIIGTSTVAVVLAEKVYILAKDQISRYDINVDLNVKKKSNPTDVVADIPNAVEVIPEASPETISSKRKLPYRDILWILVAVGLTYYLGERIDASGIGGVEPDALPKKKTVVREQFQLDFFQRLLWPEWMKRDLSDENQYTMITRPTEIPDDIDPILNKKPRRFVVLLFIVLRKLPVPKNIPKKRRIPVWVYSPLYGFAKSLYRKFNK